MGCANSLDTQQLCSGATTDTAQRKCAEFFAENGPAGAAMEHLRRLCRDPSGLLTRQWKKHYNDLLRELDAWGAPPHIKLHVFQQLRRITLNPRIRAEIDRRKRTLENQSNQQRRYRANELLSGPVAGRIGRFLADETVAEIQGTTGELGVRISDARSHLGRHVVRSSDWTAALQRMARDFANQTVSELVVYHDGPDDVVRWSGGGGLPSVTSIRLISVKDETDNLRTYAAVLRSIVSDVGWVPRALRLEDVYIDSDMLHELFNALKTWQHSLERLCMTNILWHYRITHTSETWIQYTLLVVGGMTKLRELRRWYVHEEVLEQRRNHERLQQGVAQVRSRPEILEATVWYASDLFWAWVAWDPTGTFHCRLRMSHLSAHPRSETHWPGGASAGTAHRTAVLDLTVAGWAASPAMYHNLGYFRSMYCYGTPAQVRAPGVESLATAMRNVSDVLVVHIQPEDDETDTLGFFVDLLGVWVGATADAVPRRLVLIVYAPEGQRSAADVVESTRRPLSDPEWLREQNARSPIDPATLEVLVVIDDVCADPAAYADLQRRFPETSLPPLERSHG